ncbi:MAG TPA: hemolysin family protein [candidate division Zixibacteria bacterium]|nr:hemolysin family protein [candidate division Zixibacteria bacterium]
MKELQFELMAIVVLILANSVFAMSEIALVAARKSRLKDWADKGWPGAKAALELASQPSQFFSTVQAGITLSGILAGAFGGRAITHELGLVMKVIPGLGPYSDTVALVIVVAAITYLSVVLGELVPKRIALNHAEAIAAATARPMRLVSAVSAPVVRLLGLSTELLFRAAGIRPGGQPPVTEEEVKTLIRRGAAAGVFEATERDMIEAVIRLGDKSAPALMTPRTRIVWLDVGDSIEQLRKKIFESGHSRFPVCNGSLEEVIGITHTKNLLANALGGRPVDLKGSLQPPVFVPRSMTGLQVLEHIKRSGSHLVLVVDEYGGIEGLLTHHDILEAIAGEMPFGEKGAAPKAVRRHDGSWLLDGMLAVDEFKEIFRLESLPGEKKDAYQTLGGFLFTQMGRVPAVADRFEWNNFRFEIVDMDGKRIDKVLVSFVDPVADA